MPFSDTEYQLLWSAYGNAHSHLQSVEQREQALFRLFLKPDADRAAALATWVRDLTTQQTEALGKHDANVESTRKQLARGLEDLTALGDTVAKAVQPAPGLVERART